MGAAYQRGMVLYGQKRYAMAADEFRKELAQAPTSALAMAMLALSLNYDHKPREALAHAQAAVAADPERGFAHYALACITVGPPARWTKVNPFQIFSRVARMSYRRRLRKAIPSLEEAIRIDPRNSDYLAMMSAIKLDQQKPREALQWADKSLACQANHIRSINLRGRALARLGRALDARQAAQSALALDPDSASTHLQGGWTHLQAGDPRQAVKHFEESVRLDPNNATAHQGLKAARGSLGRLGKKAGVPLVLLIAASQLIRIFATDASGNQSPALPVALLIGVGALAVLIMVYRRKSR